MNDTETMEELTKLEEAYGQQFGDKFEMWINRFRDYGLADFRVAIEDIIRTRERFPGLATMYKALNDCHASIGGKYKIVVPYVLYKDKSGYEYALKNKTGVLNGEPPKELHNSFNEPVFYECIFNGGTPTFLNVVIDK